MDVIFTYDTEEPGQCIPKLHTIFEVHSRFDAPLTIFVVGELAESEEGKDLGKLLDKAPALWDVNSHTYSHSRLITKNPWSQPVPTPDFIYEEVLRGVQSIQDRLGRPCRGFRPRSGCGGGFRGCPTALDALRTVGCTWSSAYLKSIFEDALPGDLSSPFTYQADGFDDILELPGHGWQDFCLKPFRDIEQYAVRWPSEFVYPKKFVETPQEEFEVHRGTLDAAANAGLPFCCLVLHPWTMIHPRDPDGTCVDLLLSYVRTKGWDVTTLDEESNRCRRQPDRLVDTPLTPPQRTVGYDIANNFA